MPDAKVYVNASANEVLAARESGKLNPTPMEAGLRAVAVDRCHLWHVQAGSTYCGVDFLGFPSWRLTAQGYKSVVVMTIGAALAVVPEQKRSQAEVVEALETLTPASIAAILETKQVFQATIGPGQTRTSQTSLRPLCMSAAVCRHSIMIRCTNGSFKIALKQHLCRISIEYILVNLVLKAEGSMKRLKT
eukprot:6492064-Amphidinium_carterae.1